MKSELELSLQNINFLNTIIWRKMVHMSGKLSKLLKVFSKVILWLQFKRVFYWRCIAKITAL